MPLSLGLGLGLTHGGGVFSPASLGAALRYWYDPQAPDGAYQDTALTSVVTTWNGSQSVRALRDYSGRANHITSTSAAKSPLADVNAGAKRIVWFDGADDCLQATFGMQAYTHQFIWGRFRSNASGQVLAAHGNGFVGDGMCYGRNDGVNSQNSVYRDGAVQNRVYTGGGGQFGTTTGCMEFEYNGSVQAVRKDGVDIATSNSGTLRNDTSVSVQFCVGMIQNVVYATPLEILGMIAVDCPAALPAGTVASIRAWGAQRYL